MRSRPVILKDRAEYGFFRLLVLLVRLMPLDAASAIMGKAWRAIAPLTPRHKRVLEHLAAAFPDKDAAWHRRVAAGMWDNLGRVTAEALSLDKILADPARVDCAAWSIVDKMDKDGIGGVLVSLHAGNWELCLWPAVQGGLNPASAYQRVKNPLVDAWVRRTRAPVYPGGLHAKSGRTSRLLYDWVAKGGHLGLLTDHRETRAGIEVPFFGKPSMVTPFPAALACKLGVPLVAGRVIRLGGVRFRVDAEEVPVTCSGDYKADVEATTRAIHAVFERWIREYPGQWMWTHRRWKMRPQRPGKDVTQQAAPAPDRLPSDPLSMESNSS